MNIKEAREEVRRELRNDVNKLKGVLSENVPQIMSDRNIPQFQAFSEWIENEASIRAGLTKNKSKERIICFAT